VTRTRQARPTTRQLSVRQASDLAAIFSTVLVMMSQHSTPSRSIKPHTTARRVHGALPLTGAVRQLNRVTWLSRWREVREDVGGEKNR